MPPIPIAPAMNRLSEITEGKNPSDERSLKALAEETTCRGMADLKPDSLSDAYSSLSFMELLMHEEKGDLELCNPSRTASNGEVKKSKAAVERDICQLPNLDLSMCNPSRTASNGEVKKSKAAVERDICQLPNLDLSMLPPRKPVGLIGSLPYEHRDRPAPSAQQYCSLAYSPNPDVYRSPKAGADQPPCDQLTVFYAGTVNCYNVSADKAKAILMMARRISGSPDSGTPSSSASTPSGPLNSTPRRMVMSTITALPSPIANLSHTQSSQTLETAALQVTRKCCIQRFLEKRNERIHAKNPYLPPA